MKYLIFFLFFISLNVFAEKYEKCTINRGYAPNLERKYEASCEGSAQGLISAQSLVQNPTYQLTELIIPHIKPDEEALRIKFSEPITYDFNQTYGCKTLQCFDQLDHWDILTKESPDFTKQVWDSIPTPELYNLKERYIENKLTDLELSSATPIFKEPHLAYKEAPRVREVQEPLELNIAGKNYIIEEISENSNGVQFKITDAVKSQTFESPDFAIFSEPDFIKELSFENGSLSIIDIFDIPYTLDATPLSSETPLIANNENPLDKLEITGSSQCLEALNTYLNNKDFSQLDKEAFLKIQSQLTLHRLSWAQLNSNSPTHRLEQNILKLIRKKYDEHPEIAQEFDNINIKSRNFLSKSLPFVYEELNEQSALLETESQPYKLNIGDLKMIEIIASFEELNNSDVWDHRQFSSLKTKNSIVNYTSLINSAYLNSPHKLEDKKDLEDNIEFLADLLPDLNDKLERQIKNIILNACVEQEGLDCVAAQEKVEEIFSKDFDTIYASLLTNISTYKDQDFLTHIKFGSLYPKVKK